MKKPRAKRMTIQSRQLRLPLTYRRSLTSYYVSPSSEVRLVELGNFRRVEYRNR
jgi:hypothetical protein